MKKMSFKNKILSLILVIIITFTLVIIFTITNSFNSILERIIFENENKNIAQKAELTSNWFEEKKSDLEIYANTQVVQKGNLVEKINYLESELFKRDDHYFFFFVVNEKGDYSTTIANNIGNISDRAYFEEVLKGKTVISNPIISKSTDKPIIVIASPVEKSSQTKMIAASIKIKDLSNYINRYSNNSDGIYSFIVNKQGKIVAHPADEDIDNYYFYKNESFFSYNYDFIDQIIDKKSGDLSFLENNKEKQAFYREIPGTDGWKIISIFPQSYLNKSIKMVNTRIIFISFITIIVAIILSFYLANNIAKPIIKLQNTFKKGASGNLNIRSDIDSSDEIGEAANSFNKMMEVISDLSYNDSLTGLPNINSFKNELKKALKQNQNQKIYLCAVGVDDFKSINDSYGHNIGNEVLKKISERISKNLNDKQLISRVGDEFYFYLSANLTKMKIIEKLNSLLKKINSDYFINNHVIYVRSSLGISIYPADSRDVDKMLKNASLAMHSVKKNSSNKIAFYSINIDNYVSEKKALEGELAAALANDQFSLYYQSLVDKNNQKILGFEALIRWNHPKNGLVAPNAFIPLAEENGLIKDIGAWVLEKACQDIKLLNSKFNKNYYVSVNVSPEQFISQDFISIIQKTLKKTNIKAENLELEITERTTIDNVDYTINILNQLNKLNIKTSIDDFGTGYSSLNYIKEFAINTLKIDKSFIDGFITDANNKAIVNTIITLAHNLNLKVVAEGVETKEQAAKLDEAACDILQGYYFSHPEPIEKIIEKLNNDKF